MEKMKVMWWKHLLIYILGCCR